MKPIWTLAFVMLIALTGCKTPQTDLSYFTPLRQEVQGAIAMGDYSVKIQPDDELFITVTSQVPEAVAAYNLPLVNPALNQELLTPASAKQQTYIVNKQGDIDFPQLGMIHVQGLTTLELAQKLEGMIKKDVADPTVRVQLVNFKVNVMGAVATPGMIPITRERFTILDAIAAAGDMTSYGRRDNVLLLRENQGKTEYHVIDLNDKEVFSSPYFYMQQNDVVIVDPNQILKDNSRYNTQNSYKLQVISSIISACSVVASLIIALAVK